MFRIQMYIQITRSSAYAATANCSDIAASVNMVSKFMTRPRNKHMEGENKLLENIKGTIDCGLIFNTSGSNYTSGKFKTRPRNKHMEGAKRLWQNIIGTIDYGLIFNTSGSNYTSSR